MPFPNFHAAVLRPGLSVSGSRSVAPGIIFRFGKGTDGKQAVRSVLFSKRRFTLEAVHTWLHTHARTLGPVRKVESAIVSKEHIYYAENSFLLQDADQRIVYGVVAEPGLLDSDGDAIAREGIRGAAHSFMENYSPIFYRHVGPVDAAPIESYIASQDIQLGEQLVREGSWVLGTKIYSDAIWKEIKDGHIVGYSLGGEILGFLSPEDGDS